ncbi:fascin domain-containing protein [Terrisporobacter vanillatitrophus]|uniref:fascin domain-containing protein n=1 Tax=Terrisporobacter vanillatitrophus TaxID=3058402 RepID=UPI00336669D9
MSIDSRDPIIQIGPGPELPPWISPGPDPVTPPFPPETEPGSVIPPVQDIPKVKIKSLFSNAFIIVGYNDVLYAVAAIAQQGETFKIIPINNYQVKLRIVGGQFVRIDYNGALVADANKNNATIFNIFRTGYMEFSLMAPQGKYVNVRQRDSMLVAKSEYASPRTKFKFRNAD